MPSDYFAVLAQHSAWANRRLHRACGSLSAAEYLRERAATFGSLHATLNHILVVDRIWVARIEGRTPPPLDENQILYPDLIGLRVACLAEDERLRHLVAGLSEAMLDQPLYYRDRRGDRHETPLRLALAHLFDHHARCRGEALALLSQAGIRTPSLDLLAFLRNAGAAPAG
jgi:uncharacterized damage-inducible protein DinB